MFLHDLCSVEIKLRSKEETFFFHIMNNSGQKSFSTTKSGKKLQNPISYKNVLFDSILGINYFFYFTKGKTFQKWSLKKKERTEIFIQFTIQVVIIPTIILKNTLKLETIHKFALL